MSNTNKKFRFSLNWYLIDTMKRCGKQQSKRIWKRILANRNDPYSLAWQDQCNGKVVINNCIDDYGIVEEWCIVDQATLKRC